MGMNSILNIFIGRYKSKLLEKTVKPLGLATYSPSSCNDTNKSDTTVKNYYSFSTDFPVDSKIDFYKYFAVFPDFISVKEEESLLEEIQPIMRRMRYEFDHWDNAIQGFREIERSTWNKVNTEILSKIKLTAFPDTSRECMTPAHVLDLDEKGHIKPHIDSVRFCGDIIAGLNLLSDAVMRLQKNNTYCDVMLRRRSMYIMSGLVRQEFTHEVLPNEKSFFNESKIHRKRRISLILRSEPE